MSLCFVYTVESSHELVEVIFLAIYKENICSLVVAICIDTFLSDLFYLNVTTFFSGKMITAAYVPLPNYHSLFPDAVRANQLLLPSTQALQAGYSGLFNNMQQQPMIR